MRKKLCVFGLAVILCAGAGMSAAGATGPAAEEKINQEWAAAAQEQKEKVRAAEEWAYQDLESATLAEKEKILEARNTLIFHESWAADGWTITIERADGTIEKVPNFSSLFPGWEEPKFEPQESLDDAAVVVSPQGNS